MKRLLIISQNLTKSDLHLPKHAILRINLAWHKDLNSVKTMLAGYPDNDIFVDIPVGRKKPPNHNHDVKEIAEITNIFKNVKYVAISNVEKASDIKPHQKRFAAKVVPKIETHKGTKNLPEIINALNYDPGIVMLDHEDLFSDLVKLNQEQFYLDIVGKVIETCKKRNTHLLRVKGIIFTND